MKIIVSTLGECRFPSPLRHPVPENLFVPSQISWPDGVPPADPDLFEHAGPRARLFFDPRTVRAGVVTCGGLCPGLNNVIRSLFLELHYRYQVPEVVGFRDGYRGLVPGPAREPVVLTPERVDHIHREGGTILGTSRGPVDVQAAVDALVDRNINMLFTVGGDGTQRGGFRLHQEAQRRGYPLAVVGVPKTVDNDVKDVACTFGFATAVDVAREVIDRAHTEAHSVTNGVGLVKLMGRDAGFIAAGATAASQDVNFCLVPELSFQLDGPNGLLAALKRRLESRHHAVIVVAEGAGQALIPGTRVERDASGNLKQADIGAFLREAITMYFKAEQMEMTLRYFDPYYEIRSVPADTEDALRCDEFARNAVHAAMAGKTGMVVGHVNGHFVHVPLERLDGPPKRLNLDGPLWQAVLAATGQPETFA